MQSPKMTALNGNAGGDDSVISKLPEPNITNWLPPEFVKEKDDGLGLLPVIVMLKCINEHLRLSPRQASLINRVPAVSRFTVVLGTPSLTLFAAL